VAGAAAGEWGSLARAETVLELDDGLPLGATNGGSRREPEALAAHTDLRREASRSPALWTLDAELRSTGSAVPLSDSPLPRCTDSRSTRETTSDSAPLRCAHSPAARRIDPWNTAVAGDAERAGHVRAGLGRAYRDVFGRPARDRCAGRRCPRLSRLDADADDVGRGDGGGISSAIAARLGAGRPADIICISIKTGKTKGNAGQRIGPEPGDKNTSR